MNDDQSRIGDRIENRAGRVCRSIVDDDDFEIAIRLREHEANSLLDRPRFIARRDDDGNAKPLTPTPLPARRGEGARRAG